MRTLPLSHIPIIGCLILATALISCTEAEKPPAAKDPQTEQPTPVVPVAKYFSADSAFHFIDKQVAFGPRVPNTASAKKCGDYIFSTLKGYCDSAATQNGEVVAWDGTKLKIRNFIGYINPKASKQVLLVAHWDTRPYNDQEDTKGKNPKPILGANDGASGVGVILEMARQYKQHKPDFGLVILFVDAEDYGAPNWADALDEGEFDDSYCLGTQYWAKSLDPTKKVADWGVVLDMVGGKDARFFQERLSVAAANKYVQGIWTVAQQLGYREQFKMSGTAGLTDDHKYINALAHIPCLDIVDYDQNRVRGFPDYWHTTGDNMSIIDKKTLKAVGTSIMTYLALPNAF